LFTHSTGAQGRPYNYFRVKIKIPESQKDSHPANKVSTIKYTLVKQIIQVRPLWGGNSFVVL